MVTQQDSKVILTHSEVMKGIAAITMFFLPATTIAVSPTFLTSYPSPPSLLLSFSFSILLPFSLSLHLQLKTGQDNLWQPILLERPGKQQAANLAGFLDVLGLGHPPECHSFAALFDLAVCLAYAEE